ncbi:hypothetical protein [Haloparvum sp. PAK95]|uniref:hypothetical protein n=1 Tax=Haloparvum sp. PAK95 TaxID=3418962 RepID=UPI003D2EA137
MLPTTTATDFVGEELRVEADPAQNDTDGDGVLDGTETYTTTNSNAETGVEVDAADLFHHSKIE